MKLDSMSVLALGFAAFAGWYVLRPRAAVAQTAADQAFGMSAANRRQVGDALWQNLSLTGWINSSGGYTDKAYQQSAAWSAAPYDPSNATRRSDFI